MFFSLFKFLGETIEVLVIELFALMKPNNRNKKFKNARNKLKNMNQILAELLN